MNNKMIAIILFLLVVSGGYARGMSARDSLSGGHYGYFGARVLYGAMIIHSRALKDIGKAYPRGLELTAGWQAVSQHAWDACNCYPKSGVIMGLWDFDKPEILGYGISALYFIEPVFGAHRKISFSIRAGTGFTYLSKPYDTISNPYNLSYSTHIVFPLLLGIAGNIRLSPHLNFNLNLVYNHNSNGGLREPNKGINWPTLALGIEYLPVAYHLPGRKTSDWHSGSREKLHTTLFLYGSAKQLSHEELRKYPIAGVEVMQTYRVSRLSMISLGAELTYDGSDKEEIRRDALGDVDNKKAGFMAGHGFLLGRFVFSQAFGIYLYDPYKANDPVYQRYGLLFKINKHFQAGVNLKAHRHVADFLDFRLGVGF
jgi:hypothetical protein